MDPDTDPDPYHDTGKTAKTCLGGGKHCPIDSSFSNKISNQSMRIEHLTFNGL